MPLLSQSHLTLLAYCPRRYQYRFIESLESPAEASYQDRIEWGNRFHQLMQQQALDLPVSVMRQADTAMTDSLSALIEAAPDILAPVGKYQPFTQSEHRHTLQMNGYLLTAVYDLLVLSEDQGHIYDWKTYQQPPKREQLQDDWQTRLYLFILCETTELSPAQLSMTYWFVRLSPSPDDASTLSTRPDPTPTGPKRKPSFYRYGYSERQHKQTQQDIQSLIAALNQYQQAQQFPKVSEQSGKCDRCPFNIRCDRHTPPLSTNLDPRALIQAARQIDLDQVDELPL